MRADLLQAIGDVCAEAWQLSDMTVNSGGCAGFAAIVAEGISRAAPQLSPACVACMPFWDDGALFRGRWVSNSDDPETLKVWHMICVFFDDGVAFAVDAEFGALPITAYARRRDDLNLITDVLVPPAKAWNAYRVRTLWNSTFKRGSMRRIAAVARRRFAQLRATKMTGHH